jgi:hypothetical protein
MGEKYTALIGNCVDGKWLFRKYDARMWSSSWFRLGTIGELL